VNPHRSLSAFAIAAVIALASCARAEAVALTVPPARSMQEAAAPGNAERTLFTQGQNLYLQGSHTTAAEVLEKFLVTYPNSILTDLTLLWLGRSYFQLGRFSEAEEVGKRLHAIKDTPFADIYDNELKTALREAAQQPRTSIPDRVVPVVQPPVSAASTPKAGRDRYAKAQASRPSPAPVNAKKKTSTPTKPSAAQRRLGTSSGKPVVARNSDNKPRRQPPRASTTTRRPSSSPARVVRSGTSSGPRPELRAANKRLQRGKATPPAGKTSTAALRRSTPSQRTIAAKPKSASRTQEPGRKSASNGRSTAPGSTIANRARQARSTRTPSGNQRSDISANNRRTGANATRAQRSVEVPPPGAGGSDGSRPTAISGHAVTGGLYSMIDTAMATAPANIDAPRPMVPGNVTPESRVDARSRGMNAKPGETIYLSFVVRNYGTTRQTYELRITSPGAPEAQLFVDSNGDGMHQSDELRVTGSPVIELKNSEVPFLLEVKVPRTAFEGQQYFYTVTVLSFGSGEVVAKVTSTLTVSSIRATLLPVTIPEPSHSVPAR